MFISFEMGRQPPCFEKDRLKRGTWTAEEDQNLQHIYIQEHGHGSWRALHEKADLQRCGKSCRLRWINYIRPDIKRGKFSLQEEQTIIQLHALLGNRRSVIATHLPKRTNNEIKNHWTTHLKKRLIKMGIDPMTPRPRTHHNQGSAGNLNTASLISHMAQWESGRLEAEARLVRKSSKVAPSPTRQPQKQHFTSPLARPRCLDVVKAWQGVAADMFAFSSGKDLGSPTLGNMANEMWFEKSNQIMQQLDHEKIDNCIEFIDNIAWFDEEYFQLGNDHNLLPIANAMGGLPDRL